jgi:uridine kinase
MFIIAVCGASGSGKSRFSKELKESIKDLKVEILSTDSFYKDYKTYTEKQKQDFADDNLDYDNPELMDRELLMRILRDLKAGKDVKIPVYNFDTYKREEGKFRMVKGDVNVVILEGIFTLSFESLLELYDLSVFIDTPDDICLGRRLLRNSEERNGPFGDFSFKREFDYYCRFTMPFFRKNRRDMINRATFMINGMKKDYGIIFKMIYKFL